MCGVDLGQTTDPTAVCVLEVATFYPPMGGWVSLSQLTTAEREEATRGPIAAHWYRQGRMFEPPPLFVAYLKRLLNKPYPVIVDGVLKLLNVPPIDGRAMLVVDATGVGRPVVDMFVQAGCYQLAAITITGGNQQQGYSVPKRDLISSTVQLLQRGVLRLPANIPDAPALQSELLSYQVKIDERTAHDSYNARSGQHDDLVLALAMGCWWIASYDERYAYETRKEPQYAQPA